MDAHNDLAWEIRVRYKSRLDAFDFGSDLSGSLPGSDVDAELTTGVILQTDLRRLRAGHFGGQFWSVYVPVSVQGPAAVEMALEQIDLVKRLTGRYPNDLEMAYTAADVVRIHKSGRIASLIGMEGGHMIDSSLAILRQMYVLGVRYMTLAHFSNTPWADSATDRPVHHGLSPFGADVVHEMNRLGMMIDISHVSPEAMRSALALSQAPVIFSHSSARALVDHPRNVPDDVLKLLAANGGVVMVNFYPGYISEAHRQWSAQFVAEQALVGAAPPFGGLYMGQPELAKRAMDQWKLAHPEPTATLADVADHIDHVRKVAGVDHVGFGSDFDGMELVPQGLEDVSKYPAVLIELMRRGWSDEDIAKVAGNNLLRVMASVERTAQSLQKSGVGPSEATLVNDTH